jgi:hypothetical protein
MRFAKSEILDAFQRQDRSYRLAILASHWLQGGAQYQPSANNEARGLQMGVAGRWITYSDLADLLDDYPSRMAITTDFCLNQLHALIRSPFEHLSDYCEDFDQACPGQYLVKALKGTDWYDFARVIRNTVSHNFRFQFSKGDMARLPITWKGISLTQALDGTALDYKSFWHGQGYVLFLEMRSFAEALPSRS